MTQIEALRRLGELGAEAFAVRDAAAHLGVTPANAHIILRRLAAAGFAIRLARNRWALAQKLQRVLLPEHLAAPYPAYLSLHTALFHHGLIEQVPAVLYAVTTGRTRRIDTPAGAVSLHHMPARFFNGFETTPEGAHMAAPEKALFDALYLGPGRSRLFASLPEVSPPRGFRWPVVRRYAQQVSSPLPCFQVTLFFPPASDRLMIAAQ